MSELPLLITSQSVSYFLLLCIHSSLEIMGLLVCRCCSITKLCLTLCDPMDCSLPGFPVLHPLPEFAQTQAHQGGDAIQSSHPLSTVLLLPSIFPSIRVFSNESAPKNWSSSSSPSIEYSGLISFRIDWFHLHAVQGSLMSLLQYHSSKADG